MQRRRAPRSTAETVVGALEARALGVLDVPERPDHVDRLFERVDALPGSESPAAHGLDPVPEGARTDPELGTAAAQDVEARDRACQHGRRAKRQVEHVRGEAHAARPGGDERQQRPGVEEPRLVGVVLEGHEVETRPVGERRELDDRLGVLGGRGDEDAELERVAVVGHAVEASAGSTRDVPGRPSGEQAVTILDFAGGAFIPVSVAAMIASGIVDGTESRRRVDRRRRVSGSAASQRRRHYRFTGLPPTLESLLGMVHASEDTTAVPSGATAEGSAPMHARRNLAVGVVVAAVISGLVAAQLAQAKPSASQGSAPPASSSCSLGANGNPIKHVIYLQFDNVHYRRDAADVPSDLEQMPHLLNFLQGNGTLMTNDHTILISHTAGGILSSLTGEYPDRNGQTVTNGYGFFKPDGTIGILVGVQVLDRSGRRRRSTRCRT